MLCDFYPIDFSSDAEWFVTKAPEFGLLFCVIAFISDELVEVIK